VRQVDEAKAGADTESNEEFLSILEEAIGAKKTAPQPKE